MEEIKTFYDQVVRSSNPSVATVCEVLKRVRKHEIPCHRFVLKYARKVLDSRSALGDEYWNYVEQIGMSALAMNQDDVAQECLTLLQTQFPESTRVRRYEGLFEESQSHFSTASEIYDQLLTKHPSNALVAKRTVSMALAQGRVEEAIATLNEYLSAFGSDQSGWIQLAETHASLGQLQEAIYCYEEVLLLSPRVPAIHTRLGELYYSIGELSLSRSYLSSSLTLQKRNNLRALISLRQCCRRLLVKEQQEEEKKGEQKNRKSNKNNKRREEEEEDEEEEEEEEEAVTRALLQWVENELQSSIPSTSVLNEYWLDIDDF